MVSIWLYVFLFVVTIVGLFGLLYVSELVIPAKEPPLTKKDYLDLARFVVDTTGLAVAGVVLLPLRVAGVRAYQPIVKAWKDKYIPKQESDNPTNSN